MILQSSARPRSQFVACSSLSHELSLVMGLNLLFLLPEEGGGQSRLLPCPHLCPMLVPIAPQQDPQEDGLLSR